MSTDLDLETPEPLTIEVAGHPVTVTYSRSYYGSLVPTISFPPPMLRHLDQIDVLERHPDATRYTTVYEVLGEDGTVIASTEWRWDIESAYRSALARRARGESVPALRAELDELMADAEQLRARGLYWPEFADAFSICRRELSYGYVDVAMVTERLGRARKLLARLSGPFVEVVVNCLIEGSIFHREVYNNNHMVRSRLVELYIRSGGFVDVPDDAEMALIYRRRLEAAGVENLEQVQRTDLGIQLADYFDWVVYEGIVFAPEQIAAVTAKGTSQYRIAYHLVEVDGEMVPRGVVCMPLSVYQKLQRPLETLPHGIELFLELTVQRGTNVDVVAKGVEGHQIQGRIAKYRGGQRRSKSAPPDEGILRRRSPAQASEVPPWCVARRPGRWR